MTGINTALDASKDAIDQLIVAGERTGTAWTAPRASGKWSPSQIVEHVARSLEESANMAAGRSSKFPRLPALIHPVVREAGVRHIDVVEDAVQGTLVAALTTWTVQGLPDDSGACCIAWPTTT